MKFLIGWEKFGSAGSSQREGSTIFTSQRNYPIRYLDSDDTSLLKILPKELSRRASPFLNNLMLEQLTHQVMAAEFAGHQLREHVPV